jgi:hypothetical protein
MKRLGLALCALTILAGGCSSSESTSSTRTSTTARPTPTTTTTARPAADQTPPPSINGLVADGATLWIASIKGDQILQVDRGTGAILRRFPTAGAGPDDVALARNGDIYSTGFANGDVGRIHKGRYRVLTTIAPGINPIEFSSTGVLYVGTYGPNGKLYRVTTSGHATLVATGLPDINAFAAVSHGKLLAPAGGISGPGKAILIDPVAGSWTTVATSLPPVAAATDDPKGIPHVLANISGEVFAIDLAHPGPAGAPAAKVTQGAPFDNLAYATDGTLYVSSFTTPSVTEISPDGSQRVIHIGA